MSSTQRNILLLIFVLTFFAFGVYNVQLTPKSNDTPKTTSSTKEQSFPEKSEGNSSAASSETTDTSDTKHILDGSGDDADSDRQNDEQQDAARPRVQTSEQSGTESDQSSGDSNTETSASGGDTGTDFPQKGESSDGKEETPSEQRSTDESTVSAEESLDTREASDTDVQDAQNDQLDGEPPFEAGPDRRWYRVKEGDSMWKISKKEYGSGKHFSDIWELNKDRINDYNELNKGDWLLLPENP